MDPNQQRAGVNQPRPPTQTSDSSAILTVFIPFVAIAAMVLIPSSPSSFKNSLSILHQVPEGHVGVYWRGGALLKTITEPGFHLKSPFLTQYEPVQVVLQTDMVTDIPCGTKGGVMINFEKIEVVNRLHKEYVYETLLNYGVHYDKTWIYDKIHHEINQFCSSHSLQQVYIDVFDQIDEKMKDALQVDCTRYAPGIEIISVRVTKPTIPDSIRRNFEQMEEERTKVLIAIEKQKVSEKEAETSKKMAISEAEKNANVSKILMEQKLSEKDGSRRQEEIENQMYLAREKSLADADFYRAAQRIGMDPNQENDVPQAPTLDPILPPQGCDCWALSSLRKLAYWGSSLRAVLPAYISARISVGNEVMKGVREAAAFASSSILTVFLPLIAIAAMVLILSSPSSSRNSVSILHQVPKGHVGVYWRGGALLKTTTEPGFHLKLPFLTQYEPVQVVLHTDMVTDIPCGTKGGVMINFEKIEVVNRLHKEYVYETLLNYGVHYDKTWIYDKIHHEINRFCSSHSLHQVYVDVFDQIGEKMKDALQVDCSRYAPGIEIISVRLTKPTIPDNIRHNFEQMEEERAKVLIAMERQKVAQMEAETLKKVAISEAEKNANVCKILMERKLLEMEGSMRQLEIENQMFLEREKIVADAAFYRATKEAEANKLKLTPEFLKLKLIEAFGEEAKRSFGDKVFLAYPLLLVLPPCLLFFSGYFVTWCTTSLENNLRRGRQMLGLLAGIVRHFC